MTKLTGVWIDVFCRQTPCSGKRILNIAYKDNCIEKDKNGGKLCRHFLYSIAKPFSLCTGNFFSQNGYNY